MWWCGGVYMWLWFACNCAVVVIWYDGGLRIHVASM